MALIFAAAQGVSAQYPTLITNITNFDIKVTVEGRSSTSFNEDFVMQASLPLTANQFYSTSFDTLPLGLKTIDVNATGLYQTGTVDQTLFSGTATVLNDATPATVYITLLLASNLEQVNHFLKSKQ